MTPGICVRQVSDNVSTVVLGLKRPRGGRRTAPAGAATKAAIAQAKKGQLEVAIGADGGIQPVLAEPSPQL